MICVVLPAMPDARFRYVDLLTCSMPNARLRLFDLLNVLMYVIFVRFAVLVGDPGAAAAEFAGGTAKPRLGVQ